MPIFGSPNVEKLEAKRDVQGLIKALGRKDYVVQTEAAAALGRLQDARAVMPLIAALKSTPEAACEALVKIGAPSVEPLITALEDNDSSIRSNAACVLGDIGDTRAVEPLIVTLKDKDWMVAHDAALALGRIGDSRAVEPLAVALKLGRSWVRSAASKALIALLGAQAAEYFIPLLKDEDMVIRLEAVSGLGEIGGESVVEALGTAIKDRERAVRQAAAAQLQGIGSTRARAMLTNKDVSLSDLFVRSAFRWAGDTFYSGYSGDLVNWQLKEENEEAISWFRQQDFVPIPTSMGDKGAAEYCFSMASQAQNSGILQEAWAGFHLALRYFLGLHDEKMIGLTCFRLGQVYGARENWDMAQLMFFQSAYLAREAGDRKGFGWSLFYLGDTYDRLGDRAFARGFVSDALAILVEEAPERVPEVEEALRRLAG
jgi:tetratricopeptide (TPR) repeat protein